MRLLVSERLEKVMFFLSAIQEMHAESRSLERRKVHFTECDMTRANPAAIDILRQIISASANSRCCGACESWPFRTYCSTAQIRSSFDYLREQRACLIDHNMGSEQDGLPAVGIAPLPDYPFISHQPPSENLTYSYGKDGGTLVPRRLGFVEGVRSVGDIPIRDNNHEGGRGRGCI